MRYNLESTLPIHAFLPRGGRGPFARGMTLEGGGGGIVGKVFSGAAKAVTNVAKAVVQPVYNATLKQIPGVDQALVNLDKSVGKAIPGGWGTVASVASSFIPVGSPLLMGLSKTQLATGLGALTGSGVFNKGNQFNLMGAVAGGALAYGLSNLSEGLQEAGKATPPSGVNEVVEKARLESAPKSLTPFSDSIKPTTELGGSSFDYYKPPVSAPTPVPGQFVPPSADSFVGLKDVAAGAGNIGLNPAAPTPNLLAQSPGFLDKLSSGTGNLLSGTGSSMADTGAGIKNLAGFGAQPGTQAAAYDALTSKFGAGSLGATIMGASGLSALQQQKDLLNQQLAQGNIAQDQYNQELKAIEDQEAISERVVKAYPYNPNPSTADIAPGETYYAREKPAETLYPKTSRAVYAQGGAVQGLGSLNKYALGGVISDDYSGNGPLDGGFNFMYPRQAIGNPSMAGGVYAPNPNSANSGIVSMATGGMPPRFLSGGGDGMSDSIPANIGGTQEARLADGEFVIPADVVSHLGNGSSKAGAKQLYSMMDRVRQARTGRKSQGKQINPRKYMVA